ncbi:MAG: ATP-dependent Clp protease adaptor ClpS [Haliscomenobacter sp.]
MATPKVAAAVVSMDKQRLITFGGLNTMATNPKKWLEDEEVALAEEWTEDGTGNQARLLVYNDDHNTFDWVIQCLIEVLDHSEEQAEQLSLIIHFKGKATVKTAPVSVLKPKKEALIDRGLSAVIEEDAS